MRCQPTAGPVSIWRLRQLRRLARGCCIKCATKRVNALHCERHRIEVAALSRLRQLRKRPDADMLSDPERRCCGICRQPGHYKKSCPDRPVVAADVDETKNSDQSSTNED